MLAARKKKGKNSEAREGQISGYQKCASLGKKKYAEWLVPSHLHIE